MYNYLNLNANRIVEDRVQVSGRKRNSWEIFGLLIKKIYKNSYVTKSTVSLYI
tara:strand:+ start:406 stop:564 length:159 start_codon:yes stop_codon:yes gene_type:complete